MPRIQAPGICVSMAYLSFAKRTKQATCFSISDVYVKHFETRKTRDFVGFRTVSNFRQSQRILMLIDCAGDYLTKSHNSWWPPGSFNGCHFARKAGASGEADQAFQKFSYAAKLSNSCSSATVSNRPVLAV